MRKLRSLTRAAAWRIVGGLSRTTKMPCHSWGIPATRCRVGSRLAKIAGSVCHGCYALKGNYRWSNVRRALERRLELSTHPRWVEAMAFLVAWQARANGDEPFFRWFDSGDLQDVGTLQRIAEVARRTPDVRHWLPTREHAALAGAVELLRHGVPDDWLIPLAEAARRYGVKPWVDSQAGGSRDQIKCRASSK